MFPRGERERGFTLVELMTVVAMVAILALIAVVSYRKFLLSSKTSEATYMVGAIRSAEESYRAETLTYLSVSAGALPGGAFFFPRPPPSPTAPIGVGSASGLIRRWCTAMP